MPRTVALACLVLALAVGGLVTAAPAAAIDDPARPDARVTHGPSCRPGGLVVEVVAGTLPYAVRLSTTRQPAGEAEAIMSPGATVVLRTGEVEPGETIDGRLEYTAQDGSGDAFVDELDGFTLTRPTVEECARATSAPPSPPPSGTPTPSTPPSSPPSTETPAPSTRPTSPAEPADTTSPTPTPPRPTSEPSSPGPSATPTTPAPAVPGSTPPGSAVPGSGAPGPALPGGAASGSTAPSPASPSSAPPQAGGTPAPVPAGGTVRVRVEGYQPGEQVTIGLRGSDEVLGSATAGADGSVVTEVRIPEGTEIGAAWLDVVGEGAAAVVPFDVAGAAATAPDDAASRMPLLAAAGALAATGGGLLSMTRRRPGRS